MNDGVVIGYGVIGKAVAEAFGIDKYYSRSDSNITLEEAAKKRYIFICLPTPTIEGRNFTDDIVAIINVLTASGLSEDSVIIIRSTVYPGFNKNLQEALGIKNIVSNPEFINNDTAVEDMKKPDLVVIGADEKKYRDMVVALYKGRFKYIEPVITDSTTAELIKYALNTFFATKVVFANEIFDVAQEVKANYRVVQKVLEKHKWGSKGHFEIFHKGGRGAGGNCLKKDMEAFIAISRSPLFITAANINDLLLGGSAKQ